MKLERSDSVIKRKSKIFSRLLISLSLFFVLSAVVFFAYRFIYSSLYNKDTVFSLKKQWASYDYKSVFDISNRILDKNPFNNSARIYRGYSAFFLALSETDSVLAQEYLDISINNLRISLQNARKRTISQICYMLGKAYYYKNVFSSFYYYADLAVKYLTEAKELGYKNNPDDIPEYLGLSYASLGKTMESLASFTEALLIKETDFLLLSIAEQYFKSGQRQAAEQYLFRIKSDCKDENIILKSRLLLSDINFAQNKTDEALAEILAVLEIDEANADAYYKLGLIYEKNGDFVKARSQWRKALKIQPSHQGVLKKLADYR